MSAGPSTSPTKADVGNIEFMIASGASATPMNFETFRLTANLRRIAFPWGMRNNIVVFHGPEGILLVDSGFSKRAIEAIRKTIAGFARGDIRYVINTHSNMDHVAGNGIAPDSSAVIGYGKLVNGEFGELAPQAAEKLTGRQQRSTRPSSLK